MLGGLGGLGVWRGLEALVLGGLGAWRPGDWRLGCLEAWGLGGLGASRRGGLGAWRPGDLDLEAWGLAWRPGDLEAWGLGGLDAWRLGGLDAWRPGGLEACGRACEALGLGGLGAWACGLGAWRPWGLEPVDHGLGGFGAWRPEDLACGLGGRWIMNLETWGLWVLGTWKSQVLEVWGLRDLHGVLGEACNVLDSMGDLMSCKQYLIPQAPKQYQSNTKVPEVLQCPKQHFRSPNNTPTQRST